jgi:hypothetical protein
MHHEAIVSPIKDRLIARCDTRPLVITQMRKVDHDIACLPTPRRRTSFIFQYCLAHKVAAKMLMYSSKNKPDVPRNVFPLFVGRGKWLGIATSN